MGVKKHSGLSVDNHYREWAVYLIGFCVFIVTAIASYGFHQADEHCQIIEYAGIKSGTFTPIIAWEYAARMRPMLQPTICLLFLRLFSFLSVTNPFVQTLVMRIFAAVLSYAAIWLFVRNTAGNIASPRYRIWYVAMSFLLWFVPYIACRFSSETFSGLFFMAALALYFSKKETRGYKVLIGAFFALSFIFRFQMGLAIAGFGLWALLIDKCGWRYFIVPILSFTVTYLILGIGVDCWFYGEFVFAPYNYVKINSEVSSEMFSTSPCWFYLVKLFTYPTCLIGVPLVAALILLVVRDPKNPYLWCFLPFFAVHSLIAHKEMRFLFPMAFLAAAIWMSAFLLVEKRWKERRILWSVGKVLMVMIIAVNVLGLTVNMSKGAGNNQKLYLQKYINSDLKEKDVNIIYTDRYEPYEESEVNKGFYKLSNATMRKYTNINDLEYLTRPEAVNLFVCSKKDLKDDIRSEELKAAGWEFLSQSVPVYAEKILAYYPHYNTEKTYVIFRHAGDSYNNGMKDK